MHAKYEVSITSYGSKVIAKVKVDNRQTNRQTDRKTNRQTNRQDKNNKPTDIRYDAKQYWSNIKDWGGGGGVSNSVQKAQEIGK